MASLSQIAEHGNILNFIVLDKNRETQCINTMSLTTFHKDSISENTVLAPNVNNVCAQAVFSSQ